MAELTYEHGGKLYRKVERGAKAGDYVVITKPSSEYERYSVGDILRAERVIGEDGIENTSMARYGNKDGFIHREEYVVLEEVGEVERTPATESHDIEALNEELSTLRRDLRTFAEESTETAHELKSLGKDVAKMDESIEFLDEKISGIVEGMYADSRKDFTPAERLQYAIASGASAEEVRSFYDGFTIAIVEYSDGLDSLAPGKLAELRELVVVYREFTKSLSKGSGGE